MIRKIDDLGRIVIPKEIRKELNINVNDKLKIMTDGNKIILSKEFNTVYEIEKEIERLQNIIEDLNDNR